MQITIPHKFTKAEAKERVMIALREAHQKLGNQATIEKEEWTGDTLNFGFTVQGQSITGTFEVRDNDFNWMPSCRLCCACSKAASRRR